VKNTSSRHLFLHPQVQPLVAKLAAGRSAEALLFGKHGYKAEAQNLRRKVHQICAAAGVPSVTTHSLRGWYATSVYQRSLDPSQTAAMLGHSDFGMTEHSYLDPSAAARARVGHVGKLLGLSIRRPAPARSSPTWMNRPWPFWFNNSRRKCLDCRSSARPN
jgi:integrase